ncbi:MAG TPA: hypothetical protein DCQ93_07410 [Bacteroidetes bacterium]|nr:hypothetical protein [Bacteroidota bacterium]
MKKYFLFLLTAIHSINFTEAQSLHDVIITEINYNSDSTVNSGNWIEIYNSTSNSINLVDWFVKNNNNDFYTIGPGVSLGAHSYLVLAENIFEFSSIFPSVTNVNGPMNFGFSNNNDNIRLYSSNSMLISSVAYADSGQWPKGADGNGRTLELLNYNGDQNDPLNWFDGCMFGSPGVAYTPCNPEIVFSEINYKSAPTMDAGDWVELYNVSQSAINLNQWSLKDGEDTDIYYLPNITLQPGDYRVLCQDIGKFVSRHATVGNINGPFGFGFSHKGEPIRLFDANGKLTFSVVYDNKSPWATTPDSGGYTLELSNIHGHMDDGTNWFAGCLEGSPGEVYDPNCGGNSAETISENVIHFNILNSLSSDFVVAEISGIKNYSSTQLSVYDLTGRKILSVPVSNSKTEINISALVDGIYFASLKADAIFLSEKFLKQ